jgi:hypothetical protein
MTYHVYNPRILGGGFVRECFAITPLATLKLILQASLIYGQQDLTPSSKAAFSVELRRGDAPVDWSIKIGTLWASLTGSCKMEVRVSFASQSIYESLMGRLLTSADQD